MKYYDPIFELFKTLPIIFHNQLIFMIYLMIKGIIVELYQKLSVSFAIIIYLLNEKV